MLCNGPFHFYFFKLLYPLFPTHNQKHRHHWRILCSFTSTFCFIYVARLACWIKEAPLSPCISHQEKYETVQHKAHPPTQWLASVGLSVLSDNVVNVEPIFLETEKSTERIISKVKDTVWMSIEFNSFFPHFRVQSKLGDLMPKCLKVNNLVWAFPWKVLSIGNL